MTDVKINDYYHIAVLETRNSVQINEVFKRIISVE